MLNKLYRLPKALLAALFIGAGILFILINDPPHTFCDTQVEHFEKLQSGITYKTHEFFRKNRTLCRKKDAPKSCDPLLERKRKLCQKENAPGTCYEYFAYLRHFLKDLPLLSKECSPLIYNNPKVKKLFSSAMTLMTALAWREEILTGKISKYNWLTWPDLSLFCDLKTRYIMNYGKESYFQLEKKILKTLALHKKNLTGIYVEKNNLIGILYSLQMI